MAASRVAKISIALALGLGLLGAGASAAPPAGKKLFRPATSANDPRDLSGVWWLVIYNPKITTVDGGPPPFTDLGREEWLKRIKAEADGAPIPDASTYCWPHGTPRVMDSPYPLSILQIKNDVVIEHEVNHNTRWIHLNRDHPSSVKPSFMGDSVGHWEGDTLVVDTVGVDDRTWIDEQGIIHSPNMHVNERIRKIDNSQTIEDLITVTDPKYFTRPWTYRNTYKWRPDVRLTEYFCEENNRNHPDATGRTVAR